jgi:hypothetical protein
MLCVIVQLAHLQYEFSGSFFHQSICTLLAYRSQTPLLICRISVTVPVYEADPLIAYPYGVSLARL